MAGDGTSDLHCVPSTGVPHLNTYKDVEQAIERLVDQEFLAGEFLSTLQSGAYSTDQVRYFAVQYSYYSRHFPRVLGAAIAAMEPIDTWWVPLADNLWDEAGRGISGRSHQKLYVTFLRSVYPEIALNAHDCPPVPMSDSVKTAVDTFIEFFRKCSPLDAMAAVGLGSELFAGRVMGAIGSGFEHPSYNRERQIDVRFWAVHADEHEPRHYQLCKEILCQHESVESLSQMYAVGAYIAKSEADMYRRLHHEMMNLQNG